MQQQYWAARLRKNAVVFVFPVGLLLLSACGGGGSAGEPTTPPPGVGSTDIPDVDSPENPLIIPTEQVRPYRAAGPYADVLKSCALADYQSPCKLSTLPFIGHDTVNPTVDDILDRTLVTHDWMGERLGDLLRVLPADMLKLFQPVTSILIGSEVRPSSFSPTRGRMKIDAQHLWLSVDEKRTISTEDDYRSDYGADLQFVGYWRYMKGDDYATQYFSLEDSSERQLEDIIQVSARPLYHELAHANDRMWPEKLASTSLDLTPYEAAQQNPDESVSARLYADPGLTVLTSDLYGLARVRYNDDPASDFQKNVLADYVGSAMFGEGKSRFYGYYTIYEDVATLFEQAMVKYHFGADTHVGFMNKPEGHPDDAVCADYIVAWGSRNRIAAPQVAARAKWVVEQIIGPSAEFDEFFANRLGEDAPLRVGDNWCDARFANPVVASTRNHDTLPNAEVLRRERRLFRDH